MELVQLVGFFHAAQQYPEHKADAVSLVQREFAAVLLVSQISPAHDNNTS